ncbi:MAG: hypothetical protein IKH12_11645, partial [Clostridia bacterium]|nr:hypothetical protein [Clostridia bacterium]
MEGFEKLLKTFSDFIDKIVDYIKNLVSTIRKADNRYERLFFDADKAKYENQYYLSGLLYELQSQLETQRDE